MKARTFFEGCGVGILVTLPYIWPQFSAYHSGLYHSRIAMNSVAWGALIDLAVVSALAVLLFTYLEGRRATYRNLIWALIAARLASVLVQVNSLVTGKPNPGYLDTKVFFCVTLAVALALRGFRPPAYETAAKGLGVLLSLAGFCVIWIVPELVYQGLLPHRIDPPVLATGLSRGGTVGRSASGRRIVWLLFDELSYAQTFEKRFPRLAMPAFDQLRRETVLFQNVEPAGYHTEHVLPALLLGNIVQDARSDLSGKLYVKLSGQKGWRNFDAQATIFADAHRLGWSNGIVGWYNPYCRILPGLLNFCYWNAEDEMMDGVSPRNSALENALAPLTSKVSFLRHKPAIVRQEHERSDLAIMAQAEKLIQDQDIHFVFIHLPLPHPPGIFDRTSGQFRDGGTYIDNLALADRSLGELMTTLKSTPSWAKTTLIICSDHSWRVPLWKSVAGWTKEEEAASGGKFDPRPMLMIHFPEQSDEIDLSEPFQDIQLHSIIEHMLNGDLQSAAGLESWLQHNSWENAGFDFKHARSPNGF